MMGRPSKYKTEYPEQAAKLCKLGATDRDLAEFFNVSEFTINQWKLQHEEFSKSLKLAKEEADARVEQSLYRRALGYSHDSVHISNYMGTVTQTPIVEHFPPDTTACIFWLKNRKSAEWRDRIDNTLTGPNGGPLKHEHSGRIELVALESPGKAPT